MINIPMKQQKSAGLPWLAVAGAAAIVGGAIWLGKRYMDSRTAEGQSAKPLSRPGNTGRHAFRKQTAKGSISTNTPHS